MIRRPTLAYKLSRGIDQLPADVRYDEERQISLNAFGAPALSVHVEAIETFAERDKPDPRPGTDTKAARDPGDAQQVDLGRMRLVIATGPQTDQPSPIETVTRAGRDPGDVQAPTAKLMTAVLTEASRDRDDDDSESDSTSPDDLVTGVVAF